MKIGSSVLTAAAVVCALALTQGCVTTESQGSGRGAGARHKGPFKHEHKGKVVSSEGSAVATDPYGAYEDTGSSVYDEPMISESSSYVEPAPVVAPQRQTEIYIVQKGDMLSQLAVDFDTTTARLVELNGLSNPDVLYVGQELSVPAGRGAAKTTTKPVGTIKRGGTYTIQKGDTLSGIAVAAGVTINDLRDINGIKGDKIMAGEEISIPAYGTVPSSGRSNSSSAPKKSAEPTPEPAAPAPEPAAPVFETAAPAATAPATTGSDTVIVVDDVMYPGDTLDIKAAQYGVTKAEIMRLNGITDESQVREGQTIRIPVAE
ncbi:LysM peptidoglycan-binding domain-containing protein [Pontiellaceae bacterium B12227]|nr:LysM peptidoglycan-binding domain-containing protein [Pontiellaceae bacterium B12227]